MTLVKVMKLTGGVLGGYVVYKTYEAVKKPPLPVLDLNPWWGPGTAGSMDTSIRPFEIAVPSKDVQDLKSRLSLPLRLTPALENANFSYGFNADTLTKVVDYWTNKYDWEERQKRLNSFSHYKTQIEGLDIHFIHMKPKVDPGSNVKVKPLLLIHGWPGSVIEFDEILPLLTSQQEGSDVVFEVICPSIPGYGFSDPPAKQGLGVMETAQIFLKLMERVGHEEFYVQGGDWGSFISSTMATFYPKNISGMHVNLPLVNTKITDLKYFAGMVLPSGFVFPKEIEKNFYPFKDMMKFLLRESGYMHIQSTKPDTVGAALSNSPVGLAAYILEKFSSWTHKQNSLKPDGGLLSDDFPISLDRMLDNVCLYWFTQSITSSMRYYAENASFWTQRLDEIPCKVPSAFAAFPQEILNDPKNFLKHKYKDIVSYNCYPEGGHFSAMERPKDLAKDIHHFVTAVENRKQDNKKTEL